MPTRKHTQSTQVGVPAVIAGQPSPTHRNAVEVLVDEADALDRPLSAFQGAVTSAQKTEFDLLGVTIVKAEVSQSYRVAEGLDGDGAEANGEWVTVSANSRLSTLHKKFGPRLLGYDKTRRTFVLTLWFWDVIDAESASVRVLVRRNSEAADNVESRFAGPQVFATN